jgi:hypothetical protein
MTDAPKVKPELYSASALCAFQYVRDYPIVAVFWSVVPTLIASCNMRWRILPKRTTGTANYSIAPWLSSFTSLFEGEEVRNPYHQLWAQKRLR